MVKKLQTVVFGAAFVAVMFWCVQGEFFTPRHDFAKYFAGLRWPGTAAEEKAALPKVIERLRILRDSKTTTPQDFKAACEAGAAAVDADNNDTARAQFEGASCPLHPFWF